MSDAEAPSALSAAHVRTALQKHFAGDGSIILHEVSNATGGRAQRWIDMAVVETWPSRGYLVHGIEIKISRGDWLRELKNPAKAEALHRHCDLWWIATANKGTILSTDELPPGWGWIEVKPERTVVVVKAQRQERPQHLTREFTAALLRSQSRDMAKTIDEKVREFTRDTEQRIRALVERDRASARDRGAELVRKIETAIGADSLAWMNTDRAVAAWRLVLDLNLHESFSPLAQIPDALRRIQADAGALAERITAEMAATGLEPPPKPKSRKSAGIL